MRLPLRVPHDAGHAIPAALGRADARRARRSRAGVRRARRAPDPAHGRRAARAPRLDDARRAHRAPARARRTRPDDQRGAPRAVRRAVEGGGPRSRQRQPGQPARGPFRRVDAHGPPARRAGRHRRGEARRVSAHQAELRDPARPQRRRSAGSRAFRARAAARSGVHRGNAAWRDRRARPRFVLRVERRGTRADSRPLRAFPERRFDGRPRALFPHGGQRDSRRRDRAAQPQLLRRLQPGARHGERPPAAVSRQRARRRAARRAAHEPRRRCAAARRDRRRDAAQARAASVRSGRAAHRALHEHDGRRKRRCPRMPTKPCCPFITGTTRCSASRRRARRACVSRPASS
ncbi:molybdenum cofactor biosynthesis family protein [Burkholderia pseudomallei S13]|nr:molybdenum cofactor biosynthesis family protein [Burkholderia pseudomallei S13]EEC31401.1 molybdenum cofactor biosynthesis protein A [Burkholderia pseudomallei 576]